MRDIQSLDPEWYAQYKESLQKLYTQDVMDDLSHGAAPDKETKTFIDTTDETISTFHTPLLRKGAISAKQNEPVIIPINMRDGIILGTGLGTMEWNCSAPHGAGRLMKREDVKENYTVSAYKTAMKGIYSTCINKDTLDEAPFAYRTMDEIADVIKDTVTIKKIIKPIYNYKAGSH